MRVRCRWRLEIWDEWQEPAQEKVLNSTCFNLGVELELELGEGDGEWSM